MARGEVAVQMVLGRVVERQRGRLAAQPLGIQREIAAVGRQRVARQAVLQPQGVHKSVNGVQAGSMHPKTIARKKAARGNGRLWR
jgi:hypothetical protein